MSGPRCPGDDMRFWKPEDISFVPCPFCADEVEFWKDEPTRICPSCSKEVHNPKLDPGCAKWCKYAAECRERPKEEPPDGPIVPGSDQGAG
ncbi:MAG: hypothetical protein ACE5HE_05480 [Phycisphaerae bacterium]